MSTECRWWTDEELGFLQDHEDWPASRLASMLGRGVDAVKHQRRRLSKGTVRRKEPWTQDEDETVLMTANLKASEVADLLPGRSKLAVDERRAFLAKATPGLSFAGRKNPHEIGVRPLVAKTCKGCGLLLDASWFGFHRNARMWRAKCLRCRPKEAGDTARARAERSKSDRRASVARSHRKLQALSIQHATRSGEPYVEADHKVLSDPSLTRIEKALLLGRTYAAVSQQLHIHGYVSAVGRGDPEEVRWLIDAPNAEALRGCAS
jgi:hypothetical protein